MPKTKMPTTKNRRVLRRAGEIQLIKLVLSPAPAPALARVLAGASV